jgi:hypothetical protein
MDNDSILASIDQQISNLQQARLLLMGSNPTSASSAKTGRDNGRPKGSVKKTTNALAKVAASLPKRIMSEEGKQRIAAAQKARWAEQKKSIQAANKKTSSTKKRAVKTAAPEPQAATAEV